MLFFVVVCLRAVFCGLGIGGGGRGGGAQYTEVVEMEENTF